jgi:hypothetical protein
MSTETKVKLAVVATNLAVSAALAAAGVSPLGDRIDNGGAII